MTCPECGGGRPAGSPADLLDLDHVRPGCALGDAENGKRLTDLAAGWDLRLPIFDRPVSDAEWLLLCAAAVDVTDVSFTRVRVTVGSVRRREWPGARYTG